MYAREHAGPWSTERDDLAATAVGPGGSETRNADEATALDRLDRTVAEVVAADLNAMPEEELVQRLDRLRRPIARLTAERARVTAELERRRVSATDEPARRARAQRDLRRQLADRANSTPGATKRDADAGRVADEHRETGATFADGAISADHVRLIGETLRSLPDERRQDAEAELLAIARVTNPTVFGKCAREIVAREAPAQADQAARRQHLERRVRAYDTPDGGFAFSGLLYGVAAETARAAIEAFRRPDTPDEHRSPEQRSADAFEQLCATALRVGDAPTRHGVRPHVIITMAADQLGLGEHGVAQFGSGQPVTLRQLRTLLADCTWARVLLGPDSAPIEASASVRTVPAGLWRSLVARDGGCTWPGCDAPPSWCDVAHGEAAFADGGRLSPSNAALLCRRHHRRFDLGAWRIGIDGGRVGFERQHDASGDDRPTARAAADPPRDKRGDLPERERPPRDDHTRERDRPSVDDRSPGAERPPFGDRETTRRQPGPDPPTAPRAQPTLPLTEGRPPVPPPHADP